MTTSLLKLNTISMRLCPAHWLSQTWLSYVWPLCYYWLLTLTWLWCSFSLHIASKVQPHYLSSVFVPLWHPQLLSHIYNLHNFTPCLVLNSTQLSSSVWFRLRRRAPRVSPRDNSYACRVVLHACWVAVYVVYDGSLLPGKFYMCTIAFPFMNRHYFA